MEPKEETSDNPIKVYKYRWIILFVYCAYISVNFAQFLEYSIIAHVIKKYYNVDSVAVDLTGLAFYIAYILIFIPCSIFIDKYGLKWAAFITSGLTAAGNLLKLLSLSQDRFYVVLIAQGLCAIGQVFSLMIPSKLAGTWFGAKEVSTACAIAILGTQLGVAIGCVVPSSIVAEGHSIQQIHDDLFLMIVIYAVISSVIFLLTLILFKARPQLPPSISQLSLLSSEESMSFLKSIKELMTRRDFLILMGCFGVNNGIWTMFGIIFNNVYLKYFPEAVQAPGIVALAAVIAGGCIGSVIFGYLLDKFHRFRLTSFIVLALCAISYILVICAFETKSSIASYIVIPIFGFFMGSSTVVSYEYAVEVTYPVQEEIPCAVLNAAIFLSSLISTFIVEALFKEIGYLYTNIIIEVVLVICASSVLFVSSNLLRRDANNRKRRFREEMNPSVRKQGVTFDDLASITDQWASDLEYCQNVFENQNQQLHVLLQRMMTNRHNLENIHSKLVYLKCAQDDVDRDVGRIKQYERYMEMLVTSLERKVEVFEGRTVTDTFRKQLYGAAEEVYVILKNYGQICADSLSLMKEKFECALNEPYEAIAQILMAQLDCLEQIEFKLQQLKSMAQVNDYKSKVALRLHKLKENNIF